MNLPREDREKVYELFLEWLGDEVRGQYLGNTDIPEQLPTVSPRALVSFAFAWCFSPQGHYYWADIETEWHEICREVGLM